MKQQKAAIGGSNYRAQIIEKDTQTFEGGAEHKLKRAQTGVCGDGADNNINNKMSDDYLILKR